MKSLPLYRIAKTIRSKNAGVDKITFDVIFRERRDFNMVRQSGVLSQSAVETLFRLDCSQISDFVEFEPANAIKFTVYRSTPSGSPGDMDIFGCQQYGPIFSLEVPVPDDWQPPES